MKRDAKELADWEARTNLVSIFNSDGKKRSPNEILSAALTVTNRREAGDYKQTRTGDIIRDMSDLDTLPVGSVVVPLWLGEGRPEGAVLVGVETCVRLADGWFRAGLESQRPCYPLGAGGTARVIYDPRDEEKNAEQD